MKVVVVICAVVVVVDGAALVSEEEAMEERVGEEEVEDWGTYGTSSKFFSSSSLCLLGALSTCLPWDVCVSECVCVPCVCVLPFVSGSRVCAMIASD